MLFLFAFAGDEIEEDFDAAFAKEVEGIKSKTTMKERDFQQVTYFLTFGDT